MSATNESFSCLSSCLPSRCRRADKDVHEETLRAPSLSEGNDGRRSTVYYSAKKSLALTDEELDVIRQLEEAAAREQSDLPSQDSQFFFDAVDQIGSVASMTYPPAAVANPHARATLAMDDPRTLLRSKKPAQVMRRRSSLVQLFRAPRVHVELRGYPGDLTESEVEAALKFRSELVRKAQEEEDGKSYPDMVHAFHPVEEVGDAFLVTLRSVSFDFFSQEFLFPRNRMGCADFFGPETLM